MQTVASAVISAGGAGWLKSINVEAQSDAVAWLEPLLRHWDALSRRFSGCPGSGARSQLNSRLHSIQQ